ncbi:STAM-binding protein-like [Aethina tumida]|uniref:STAM-binding protein-like n=1 Tax=Aethina tumida TaxID=116153 RepID=UPI00096B129D|nr:STAM-binding protein-like [Aethina tumida]
MSCEKKPYNCLTPDERLKQLIDYCNLMDVDYHVAPIKYYRSGLEMIRMANVYYKEGSLENAYVLYLKFMTLFLEKIRKHPDFKTVPSKLKTDNQIHLKEVLPKAEKLKQKLLEKYTLEYNAFLAEKKREATIKEPKPSLPDVSTYVSTTRQEEPTVVAPSIDQVSYPDDERSSVTPTSPAKTSSDQLVPSVDRSSKPSSLVLDNFDKNVLRTIIIPMKVMTLFQVKAASNTNNQVETCGILTGKLENHQLKITHLIIPKQKGTADSCITMNEEEIFDIQDQYNLITVGWIHTHPTQTAFLSSVDLHTHCPYQLLMPEAIAIVCSPKYNETGFFTLSTFGLKYISECTKVGFHPHVTQPELFVVASHIRIDNNAALEVIDLRYNTKCST